MKDFLNHLRDPNPGFRCRKPGAGNDGDFRDVRVKLECGKPADASDIERLTAMIKSNSDEFVQLYSMHDGMLLYRDEEENGIRFFPIEDFDAYNVHWRAWFEDLEEEELWDFQKDGVAFAEIVYSGNYFVFHDGKVFYSDHDGGDDEPFGNSLSEFLDRIAAEPARFLYEAGCYTRYGLEQWIPEEYFRDMV